MDEYYMRIALQEANRAFRLEEVPVGAIIVKDKQIISTGFNLRENNKSAIAHGEMLAIERACKVLGGWRLFGCELYVTLEPCPMCAGALVNARLDRVVFGAYDYKRGACGSIYNIANDIKLNHRLEVTGGILEKECAKLMSDFFKKKRGSNG
jgi:tRNA(adenine34) deaminase